MARYSTLASEIPGISFPTLPPCSPHNLLRRFTYILIIFSQGNIKPLPHSFKCQRCTPGKTQEKVLFKIASAALRQLMFYYVAWWTHPRANRAGRWICFEGLWEQWLFFKCILTAETCLKNKCLMIYTEKTYKVFVVFQQSFIACLMCEPKNLP